LTLFRGIHPNYQEYRPFRYDNDDFIIIRTINIPFSYPHEDIFPSQDVNFPRRGNIPEPLLVKIERIIPFVSNNSVETIKEIIGFLTTLEHAYIVAPHPGRPLATLLDKS